MTIPSPSIISVLALTVALATTSCMSDPYGAYQNASPVNKGAITGAVAGAAIGGIAEGDAGGIAVGAAIGALAGAATGHVVSQQQRRRDAPYSEGYPNDRGPGPYSQVPPRENDRYNSPATPPRREPPVTPPRTQPRGESNHPVAQKTAHPDRVISPYPPHNTIDVAGFKSGDLAIDPTTEKIFKIP